jgi:para-nitrobenzyl esterase
VYCLAAADVEDQPLFHRGIMQSLPAALREDENRDEMTKAMSSHASKTITPENAATISVRALLDLQKEILGVARTVSPALLAFGPVMGEAPLPPSEECLRRFITASKTRPMMIGWTSNEETAFTQIDTRPEAQAYLQNLFQKSSEELVNKVAAETKQMPLTYELSWHPEASRELRSTHCIDLPLLLGDWDAWKDAPMLQGEGVKEEVEALGGKMKDLWVAFAKGDVKYGQGRFMIDKDFNFKA